MRPESEIIVVVRGKAIGGPDPVICLPLVAREKSEVMQQAEELKQLNPDLVEWRIDSYENVEDIDDSLGVLASLREKSEISPLAATTVLPMFRACP